MTMSKFFVIMSKIICFIGILAFVWSCGNEAETPQAPKVVSKKITVDRPKVSKPVTATPSPPMPAIKPKPAPALKTGPKPSSVFPAKEGIKVKAPATVPGTKEKVKAGPAALAKKEAPVKVLPMAMVTGEYDPSGKIDPFVPLYKEEPAKKKETKKKKKKKRLPLTPLEKVDLSQLKLVGIIRASSGNKALVEEATGKGYIVKKGTYIGIHAGRVINILSDRIVVEEEMETTLGTYKLQKRELSIKKPPGEM
jgi:type IV pilus assembly protein PilP